MNAFCDWAKAFNLDLKCGTPLSKSQATLSVEMRKSIPYTRVNKCIHLFPKLQGNMRLTHYIRSTRKRGVAVVPRFTSCNTGSCVTFGKACTKNRFYRSVLALSTVHMFLGEKNGDLKGQQKLRIADQ